MSALSSAAAAAVVWCVLWSALPGQALCRNGGSLTGREASAELMPHINAAVAAAQAAAAASASDAGFVFAPSKPHAGLVQDVAEIERLLGAGDRRRANDVAVRAQLWAHALIISSNLTREDYQAVVRAFTEASLPDSSSLRTLYNVLAGTGPGVRAWPSGGCMWCAATRLACPRPAPSLTCAHPPRLPTCAFARVFHAAVWCALHFLHFSPPSPSAPASPAPPFPPHHH
jgi:hypothetical protein